MSMTDFGKDTQRTTRRAEGSKNSRSRMEKTTVVGIELTSGTDPVDFLVEPALLKYKRRGGRNGHNEPPSNRARARRGAARQVVVTQTGDQAGKDSRGGRMRSQTHAPLWRCTSGAESSENHGTAVWRTVSKGSHRTVWI